MSATTALGHRSVYRLGHRSVQNLGLGLGTNERTDGLTENDLPLRTNPVAWVTRANKSRLDATRGSAGASRGGRWTA